MMNQYKQTCVICRNPVIKNDINAVTRYVQGPEDRLFVELVCGSCSNE